MPKALDIPVFNYAKIGAEREAAARGNIDIIWRAPESADQLRQKEILESFITQKVDGIAISCLNGDFLTDTINRAIDAGIPVTTWDADAPKSKRLAFYGVDDLAAGRILAEQAVTLLGGKGKVAIITSIGADEPAAQARRREGGAGAAPGDAGGRGVRHQGGSRALRRDHRGRHESLSGSRRLDLGRRLAGVHAATPSPRCRRTRR